MQKYLFKTTITNSELTSLIHLYRWYVIDRHISEEDPNYSLLETMCWEHAALLLQMLCELSTGREKYTVKFNSPEAYAFYITWQITDISSMAHANVIAIRIIGEIDKSNKNY